MHCYSTTYMYIHVYVQSASLCFIILISAQAQHSIVRPRPPYWLNNNLSSLLYKQPGHLIVIPTHA